MVFVYDLGFLVQAVEQLVSFHFLSIFHILFSISRHYDLHSS